MSNGKHRYFKNFDVRCPPLSETHRQIKLFVMSKKSVIVVGGVYSFYLVKKGVEKQRYEHMKIRERMKTSNTGEYEPSTRKFSSSL
ncbi:hypothetical protein NQ317_013606 [Molorchus minor]|uniref:Uncharacterized protein n=1 Tax=Molorchus minor TaxID=1323400 RepID=A0ABQ9J5G0_9CUCU|nr:hypothetical protein NQ317_013606 [Molorchus minor]